jgi:deoxyribodipyrimidine photo-lyase
MTAIVWLRNDLRLDDQPALSAAAAGTALFVYVHDENATGRPLGGASRWWLDKSLRAFAQALHGVGGRLDVVAGDAAEILPTLAHGADFLAFTRAYSAAERETEARVCEALTRLGVATRGFNGQLLREPWELERDGGAIPKVFTPFWRRLREAGPFDAPSPAPRRLHAADWPDAAPRRVEIDALALHPRKPDWSAGLAQMWTPGESGAKVRLQRFLDEALPDYADRRDIPAGATTSQLSPHLRFGEISARRVLAAAESAAERGAPRRDVEKFQAELGWREFSYSLLYRQPDLARKNWSPRFDAFPWRRDDSGLEAWRRGRTGYPIVDAGMRELWTTGFLHNRVRMIVASFLTKHLGVDWRKGEAWFWDTLCDADEANNPASWQWVAGSGADAAPYFRVFNPVLQSEKFDPDGAYIRRFVPELAKLDARAIHAPWRAPDLSLIAAGVRLGANYPRPVVDLDEGRNRALRAFAEIGGEADQRMPTRRKTAKKSG